MSYVWIFIGGGLGTLARFAASGLVARIVGETFPWGTIVVNVSGSFLIGVVATLAAPEGRLLLPPEARQFILVGLFGGYTTFSAFSLQTLALARDGEWLQAGANVLLSVALCLVAVWLGYIVAANINAAKGP
jgi:CrcB protein